MILQVEDSLFTLAGYFTLNDDFVQTNLNGDHSSSFHGNKTKILIPNIPIFIQITLKKMGGAYGKASPKSSALTPYRPGPIALPEFRVL